MKEFTLVLIFLSLFFSCKKENNTYDSLITEMPPSSKYKYVPQITDVEWYKKDNISHLLNGYNVINNPKEWTPEITTLLETLIEKNPNHSGAHHFYIHAVEASNSSAKAFDDGLL